MPLELFLGVEFEKQLESTWIRITHPSNGPSLWCIDGHDLLVGNSEREWLNILRGTDCSELLE